MKILVGSVAHTELIKNTLLSIDEPSFVYEGKKGLNMVFSCPDGDEKVIVRKV